MQTRKSFDDFEKQLTTKFGSIHCKHDHGLDSSCLKAPTTTICLSTLMDLSLFNFKVLILSCLPILQARTTAKFSAFNSGYNCSPCLFVDVFKAQVSKVNRIIMQIITLVSCQMHLHFRQHPTRHKVSHISHQGEAPETKHTQLIHN